MPKPNVLLLFSDQHQAACLGAENHPDVLTPNLDALADGGVRFTRAYCQDAICKPSRVSMMTGVHPRRLGIFDNSVVPGILTKTEPLSEFFSRNGYRTAAFGKRHLSPEIEGGWDVKKSHMASEGDDENYVNWIEEEGYLNEFTLDWAAEFGHGPAKSPTSDTEFPFTQFSFRVSELPEDKTMEAYTAKETISFLKESKNDRRPFFCWSSFYRPHQPYTPLPKYYDLYSSDRWGGGRRTASVRSVPFDGIKRPESFPKDFEKTKKSLPPLFQSQYEGENRVWRIDKAIKNEQMYRDYLAAYYGLVTEIDHHTGEIIAALKDLNLYENTIIIYTADHGDFVGNHGMIEKCAQGHNIYEETLRVPFIIHYPRELSSGVVSDALVELTDLYPTLAQLIGGTPPESEVPLSGQSLAPVLNGKSGFSSIREYSVSLNYSQATVITERYKLGIWLDPGKGREDSDYRKFGNMLFDRQSDPGEVNNVYDDSKYKGIQQELTRLYDHWSSSYDQAE